MSLSLVMEILKYQKSDCMLWHKHISFENDENRKKIVILPEKCSEIWSGMNLGHTHTFRFLHIRPVLTVDTMKLRITLMIFSGRNTGVLIMKSF